MPICSGSWHSWYSAGGYARCSAGEHWAPSLFGVEGLSAAYNTWYLQKCPLTVFLVCTALYRRREAETPIKSIGRSTTKDKPKARENSYRRGEFIRLRTLVLGDLKLTPQCLSSASLSRSVLTAREILRAAATPDGHRRPCYPRN